MQRLFRTQQHPVWTQIRNAAEGNQFSTRRNNNGGMTDATSFLLVLSLLSTGTLNAEMPPSQSVYVSIPDPRGLEMRFKNPPIIPWSPGHHQQSLSLRRTRLSKGFRGEYDPWRLLLASTRNAYYPGKSPRVAPRGVATTPSFRRGAW